MVKGLENYVSCSIFWYSIPKMCTIVYNSKTDGNISTHLKPFFTTRQIKTLVHIICKPVAIQFVQVSHRVLRLFYDIEVISINSQEWKNQFQ